VGRIEGDNEIGTHRPVTDSGLSAIRSMLLLTFVLARRLTEGLQVVRTAGEQALPRVGNIDDE
jgi:hypothetical protein